MPTEYSTIKEIRTALTAEKAANKTIALVPTMGFLHDGHLELMRKAKQIADVCVATIFVNPTQFGPNEDLDRYPRDLERDRALVDSVGVDYLFIPTVEEMYPNYPENFSTYVDVLGITDCLCGKSRPGHFRGVATVVSKFFNIIEPDFAIFGEKDFQQLAVIRRMASDLNFDVEIVGAPIVREPDGLAMSSRNTYLSAQERQAALVISKAMSTAHELAANGVQNTNELLKHLRALTDRQYRYRKVFNVVRLDSIKLLLAGLILS
ncbi:MAG: pantoate--beta-alanine ligase [Rubrobacteridae bacterium]|nr:pantoate--beta-alanine ligase [Rubrobacteridae bacterium]